MIMRGKESRHKHMANGVVDSLAVPHPGTRALPFGRVPDLTRCSMIGVGFPKSHGVTAASHDFSQPSAASPRCTSSRSLPTAGLLLGSLPPPPPTLAADELIDAKNPKPRRERGSACIRLVIIMIMTNYSSVSYRFIL
jgi:hypothetical protein